MKNWRTSFIGDKAQPIPYKRRDFYKIMFIMGASRVQYADKVAERIIRESKVMLKQSNWSVSDLLMPLDLVK